MSDKSRNITIQASILASAGLLTKVIGFIYRIPLANIFGNSADGVYGVVFGIYGIALMLSSYSMPVAISKLIVERSVDDKEGARKVLKVSLIIAFTLGFVCCNVLFWCSDMLSKIYGIEGLQLSLRVLAPTSLIVSIMGCFRGYYQGKGNMVPTSVSQIAEQIVNAIVSIVAAISFVKIFTFTDDTDALKSAGGTMGTFSGACIALIVLLLIFSKEKDDIKIKIKKDEFINIAKSLIVIMIPIMFSQTIYQIGYSLDDLIFANVMNAKDYSLVSIKSMQSVFNTKYTQMINLPIGMATAFGVSVLPRISEAVSNDNREAKQEYINKLLGMTSFIVFPAAVGLTICSKDIMVVLFPSLNEYTDVASKLLSYGACGTVFYSFSTVTTSILQGTNNFKIPVINSFISLILHIILVTSLLWFTDLTVFALLIADLIFAFLILMLNSFAIKQRLKIKIDYKKYLFKHFISSIIMGIAIIFCEFILINSIDNSLIKLVLKII
ncbi:MAG: polysaccharide biosynthesis protein, partial [Lachnospiraceae bacterium]|nr:polysaccharide biosynthesis protein [Lachnospiraceae bacterium]